MRTNAAAQSATFDHRTREQGDANVGRHTANNAVECPELQPCRTRPSKRGEDLFQPLPVRAADAEYERGRTSVRGARTQCRQIGPTPRGDENEFFFEGRLDREIRMMNDQTVERTVRSFVPSATSSRPKFAWPVPSARGRRVSVSLGVLIARSLR